MKTVAMCLRIKFIKSNLQLLLITNKTGGAKTFETYS